MQYFLLVSRLQSLLVKEFGVVGRVKKLGNPLPGGGFMQKRITNALGGQSVEINGSGVLGQVDQKDEKY